MWWLLAAAALAVAVGVPLLVRSRRREAWAHELTAARREVTWFARELMPQLGRSSSPEALAGGWAVAAARVSALEDQLTALEATARDDAERERARTLRDAVRTAREGVQQLTVPGTPEPLVNGAARIAAGLDRALQPPPTAPG